MKTKKWKLLLLIIIRYVEQLKNLKTKQCSNPIDPMSFSQKETCFHSHENLQKIEIFPRSDKRHKIRWPRFIFMISQIQ